jgi:hypothetical protein
MKLSTEIIMKNKKVKLLLLLCLMGLVVWGFYIWVFPPKDETLIKHFNNNRDSFERLKDMLKADKEIGRISHYGISPKDSVVTKSPEEIGFPKERYEEYLKILRELKVPNVTWVGEDLRFFIKGWGFVDNGWRIAIIWRENKPQQLVDNLYEACKRTPSSSQEWEEAYRHIEGNWYLWIVW